ncbi:transcription factor SAC51 [Musa acuminata AAA Group]|uniref:transcription factor SAC51 n=1 Tax=Musa acuminata AAA Group TaxID=214697 RepID=UPI0031D7F503
MERDFVPEIHFQHSPQSLINLNDSNNIQQPVMGSQNTNLMLFPTYTNPHGCIFSMSRTTALPRVLRNKCFQQRSALISPPFPSHKPSDVDGSEKRLLVFDRSRDGTIFMFSFSGIPFPCFNSMNAGFGLQGSTETVSDGHGGEVMHEDPEEIDALLYSDSDDDHDDEEANTCHSPVGAMEKSSSEVTSSMHLAKRRRVDVDEFDSSLMDTASSAAFHHPDIPIDHSNKEEDGVAESSSVKGGDHDKNAGDKQHKKARIRETVGILRRIIPGGKGKDAATILDEAILYLKSLELKAKSLDVTRQ